MPMHPPVTGPCDHVTCAHLSSVCLLPQVDGFFTLLFGLSSINTLTVISVTRYIKGCRPDQGDDLRVIPHLTSKGDTVPLHQSAKQL